MGTGQTAAGAPPELQRRLLPGWADTSRWLYADPIGVMHAINARYGPISLLNHGSARYVFAFGPALNQQILSDPTLHAPLLDLLVPPAVAEAVLPALLGDCSEPVERSLHSVVRSGDMDRSVAQVAAHTHALIDRWGLGQQVDVQYVMRRLCLRIVLELVFGDQAHTRPCEDAFQRWHEAVFRTTAWLPLDLPGTPFHRLRKSTQHLRAEFDQLFDQINASARFTSTTGLTKGNSAAVTDQVDQTLRQAIIALVVHTTAATAATITWTTFLLSQHPRVLSDLARDIQRGCDDTQPSWEQIDQVRLLQRVIKETQRLFPPFAIGQRVSQAPFTLLGYEFEASTRVFFSPYMTHRLPELYVAPGLFRPERWLYIERETYEYLPFAASVQADQIAPIVSLISKTVLTLLIQRFRLALAAGSRVDRRVRLALEPKAGPFMIIMSPRRPLIQREAQGNVRDMVVLR